MANSAFLMLSSICAIGSRSVDDPIACGMSCLILYTACRIGASGIGTLFPVFGVVRLPNIVVSMGVTDTCRRNDYGFKHLIANSALLMLSAICGFSGRSINDPIAQRVGCNVSLIAALALMPVVICVGLPSFAVSMGVAAARCRDGCGFKHLTANGALLVFSAVCGFGSRSVDDPIACGMSCLILYAVCRIGASGVSALFPVVGVVRLPSVVVGVGMARFSVLIGRFYLDIIAAHRECGGCAAYIGNGNVSVDNFPLVELLACLGRIGSDGNHSIFIGTADLAACANRGFSDDDHNVVHRNILKDGIDLHIQSAHDEGSTVGVGGIGEYHTAADNFPFLKALALRDSAELQGDGLALGGLLDGLSAYKGCTAVHFNGVGIRDDISEFCGCTAGTTAFVGGSGLSAMSGVNDPVVTQSGDDRTCLYQVVAIVAKLIQFLACCGAGGGGLRSAKEGALSVVFTAIFGRGNHMSLFITLVPFPAAGAEIITGVAVPEAVGIHMIPFLDLRVLIFQPAGDDALAVGAKEVAIAALFGAAACFIIVALAVGLALIGSPGDGFLPGGKRHFFLVQRLPGAGVSSTGGGNDALLIRTGIGGVGGMAEYADAVAGKAVIHTNRCNITLGHIFMIGTFHHSGCEDQVSAGFAASQFYCGVPLTAVFQYDVVVRCNIVQSSVGINIFYCPAGAALALGIRIVVDGQGQFVIFLCQGTGHLGVYGSDEDIFRGPVDLIAVLVHGAIVIVGIFADTADTVEHTAAVFIGTMIPMPPVPFMAFHFDVTAAVHQADQSVRHIGGLFFIHLEGAAVIALVRLLRMVDMPMALVIGLVAAGGAGLLIDLVEVRSAGLCALAQQHGVAEGVHHRTL